MFSNKRMEQKRYHNSFFAPVKYFLPFLGVKISAALISVVPFWMIGALSKCLAITLQHIFRYRRGTATSNLQMCFPEKTQSDITQLLPQIYLNITDVFLETVKAFSISPAGIMGYVEAPSEDQLAVYRAHYRGAIMATAHFSNWEWCGYCLTEVLHNPGIAVYRPLKNPYVNSLMRSHRERSKMRIIPMREIVKTLARGASGSHFVLLIADQSPDPDGAHWVDFLGVKTAFFKGPGTLAHRYDLPMFFVHLERIRRHRYRMHLEPLCLNPQSFEVSELTTLYAKKLEALVKSRPDSWLWTHRRWKHKPPSEKS